MTFIPEAGSVVLRNGDSTQTFYLPSKLVTSGQFTGFVGIERQLGKRFLAEIDLSGRALGNKARMSFGLQFGLGILL